MTLRSSSLAVACAVILSAASPGAAYAQGAPTGNRQKALNLFDQGKVQYDLGRWKQAVDLWTQAYETFNAPEFLFNIGQAYRHEGNCEQALFFYRRYLAIKSTARNRAEVERFIKELEAKCGGTEQPPPDDPSKTKPQTGQPPPTGDDPTEGRQVDGNGGQQTDHDGEVEGGSLGGGVDDEQGVTYVEADAGRPRFFALRVAVGPSFPSMGDLDVGTLLSLSLGVGHPLYVGRVMLEPGALVTYTPVPWEAQENMDGPINEGTAAMTGLLANLGASYVIVPKLSIRAEAGAGMMIFSGLTVAGNPFLAQGENATGPISMFEARGALGLEYAFTKNIVIHAFPAVLTYSPTPPLKDGISSITRFEMLVGAGYAM